MKCLFLRRPLFVSVFVLLAGSFGSCSLLTDETDAATIEVHLQSSFAGERVQVKIDGSLVYDERVTTDQRIGLADVIQVQRTEGRHRIEVIAADRHHAEQSFRLEDRLFITVSFFSESIPEAGLEAGVHLAFLKTSIHYD